MQIKNKKSLSNQALVTITIGLAILIILLYSGYRTYAIAKENQQKEICKQALGVSSATKVKGQDTVTGLFRSANRDVSDVPCPVFYEKISTGDQEKIKKELAHMMYDSWDMMHEGKINLFTGKPGEEKFCILTHHIKFSSKNIQINNFSQYLAKEKTPLNDGRTYTQYLQCFNPTPELFEAAKQSSPGIIDTNQDYGIMFLYSKKGYLQKIWSAWEYGKQGMMVGTGEAMLFLAAPDVTVSKATALIIIATNTAAGATYGYSTGSDEAADWQACIMLFPYNEQTLKSLNCDYMPGVQGNRE